jgi:hypothetical protein
MSDNKWWEIETLEGHALILGKGFDYDAQVIVDVVNNLLIVRSPYPSKETDENYPYPNEMELVIPLDQIKKLIKE